LMFVTPDAVAEAGDDAQPADIALRRGIEAGTGEARHVQEQWSMTATGGEHLELRWRYSAQPPTRVLQEQNALSIRHPERRQLYRIDQGVDPLRGAGLRDRVEDLALTIKGPGLGKLFDGSETLAAIISLPWYIRRILLP
jgi:hypothetical protein